MEKKTRSGGGGRKGITAMAERFAAFVRLSTGGGKESNDGQVLKADKKGKGKSRLEVEDKVVAPQGENEYRSRLRGHKKDTQADPINSTGVASSACDLGKKDQKSTGKNVKNRQKDPPKHKPETSQNSMKDKLKRLSFIQRANNPWHSTRIPDCKDNSPEESRAPISSPSVQNCIIQSSSRDLIERADPRKFQKEPVQLKSILRNSTLSINESGFSERPTNKSVSFQPLFQCFACDLATESPNTFLHHLKTVHCRSPKNLHHISRMKDKKFREDTPVPSPSRNGVRKKYCYRCNDKFFKTADLILHMERQHGIPKKELLSFLCLSESTDQLEASSCNQVGLIPEALMKKETSDIEVIEVSDQDEDEKLNDPKNFGYKQPNQKDGHNEAPNKFHVFIPNKNNERLAVPPSLRSGAKIPILMGPSKPTVSTSTLTGNVQGSSNVKRPSRRKCSTCFKITSVKHYAKHKKVHNKLGNGPPTGQMTAEATDFPAGKTSKTFKLPRVRCSICIKDYAKTYIKNHKLRCHQHGSAVGVGAVRATRSFNSGLRAAATAASSSASQCTNFNQQNVNCEKAGANVQNFGTTSAVNTQCVGDVQKRPKAFKLPRRRCTICNTSFSQGYVKSHKQKKHPEIPKTDHQTQTVPQLLTQSENPTLNQNQAVENHSELAVEAEAAVNAETETNLPLSVPKVLNSTPLTNVERSPRKMVQNQNQCKNENVSKTEQKFIIINDSISTQQRTTTIATTTTKTMTLNNNTGKSLLQKCKELDKAHKQIVSPPFPSTKVSTNNPSFNNKSSASKPLFFTFGTRSFNSKSITATTPEGQHYNDLRLSISSIKQEKVIKSSDRSGNYSSLSEHKLNSITRKIGSKKYLSPSYNCSTSSLDTPKCNPDRKSLFVTFRRNLN